LFTDCASDASRVDFPARRNSAKDGITALDSNFQMINNLHWLDVQSGFLTQNNNRCAIVFDAQLLQRPSKNKMRPIIR
jgi:hypothetical protein